MAKKRTPAVDPALLPRFGVTRDGQPVSYNRMPAPELAPWVSWFYATAIDAPAEHECHCSVLSDTAMIRIQLQGEWSAETRDGRLHHSVGALYFGPQSRAMPITVRGSFTSVGIALKPGTGFTVTGLPASDFVDRIVPCDEVGLPGSAALAAFDPAGSGKDWVDLLERLTGGFLQQATPREPPALSARFELMALQDPTFSVADFAEDHGISLRQLERLCLRDFGMTPKQVLRRSRALDMASHLRGVADQAEEEELMLRYYDQSHMAREFTDLFGMSPRQFVETPQPLMTLALESRQARRLAILDRLGPDGARPWQDDR